MEGEGPAGRRRRWLGRSDPLHRTRRIQGPRLITKEAGLPADEVIFRSDSVKSAVLSSPLVEFITVYSATNNFSNKLGGGGFGPVYKGVLPDGQEIAVKRLSNSSGQGLEEFKNEVIVLSKLQHRNLVRLFGCCVHGEEKMLLYEYMPNKSLDSFIFDESKRLVFGWKLRYKIIQGIGRGLLYLHQDSRLKIIHRDLKASNILLDDDFNPKISDFGMARIFGEHQLQALTHRIIVSGRRNSSFVDEEWSMNLLGYAWTLWKEGIVSELIDPLMGTICSYDEVCRCIQVGLLCVQELPGDRPSMSLVLRMLSGDVTLTAPKQAAFFVGRVPLDDNDTGSGNQLTQSPNLLHLFAFFFFLSVQTSAAAGVADKLDKGQNITDGQTLVSSGGGSYTLGFFSPGKSTKRYLGIWFTVSRDTVYWVANRDRPLDDNSGVLLLNDDGSQLVLLDGSRRTVWSASLAAAAASTAVVQLLDSGNLVVRNGSGSDAYLWQSFDQPSDTLLPGMKMGKSLWSGQEWFITAWRSADDPSPGDYRRTLTTEGLPELVLWRGGATKVYRTGPWNGRFFNGVPEASNYSDKFPLLVTSSEREVSYGSTPTPGAPLTRVVVNYTGVVERLVWDASSRAWQRFFQGPRDPCDNYARCGPFGLCDADAAATSFCGCVVGFTAASPSAWALRNTSGGCRRNVALDCAAGGRTTTDKFKVVRGVKLPDTHSASVDMGATAEECERRCLGNCSCVAYAAADINGGGCVIWADDIVDLRYVDRGQDLYLRLAKAEFDVIPDNPSMGVASVNLATIKSITENFSQNCLIGEGGFSTVYKGVQSDGRMVAVKRLKQSALTNKGKKDFAREVAVMAGLHHGSLLRLLAYCNEGNERILIYAYMKNRSLDNHIFGPLTRRANLHWRLRLDIIQAIAKGVAYLHEGPDGSVIHRDLKLSNILLDDELKPKIADFGTAKLFVADQSGQTLVVSQGYASPEYALRGEMTLKCDVYSFGVVLLETLSGVRNGSMQTLLPQAWRLWEHGNLIDLLDPAMARPASDDDAELLYDLERCINIGLLCIQDMADDRPTMSEVVAMLTSRTSQMEQPKRPTLDSRAAMRPLRQTDVLGSTTTDLT
uniref:non-specific serine/threonine protein kinase n=1 Tax=Oryza punctata TaxID=4537 RepID=A0A0E0KVP4_ORYPU